MANIEAWSAETFTALQEGTGAIYPMVGTEWLWLIIAVVFWLMVAFSKPALRRPRNKTV